MRLRPLVLACVVAACGDNGGGGPDAAAPPPDAAPPACLAGRSVGDVLAGAWDPRFTIAGVTGDVSLAPAVFDLARAPDGSILAAGRFRWFGAQAMPGLMRWRDGAWEPARTTWEVGAPIDGFTAVAVSPEGHLALATNEFFLSEGQILLDQGGGLRVIARYDGAVRRMAWYRGELWVAGSFQMVAPVFGRNLMAWADESWFAPGGGALFSPVYEVRTVGDELLLGGAFPVIGPIEAHRVASWDGQTWTPYDLPEGMAVYAVTRAADGTLYAGGAVVAPFGGAPAGGLVRWSEAGWELVGGGLGGDLGRAGVVTDVAAHDGVIDVVGCFTSAGGPPEAPGAIAARGAARWDGTAWHPLDATTTPVRSPWAQPDICGDEHFTAVFDVAVQRVIADGDRLLVGGLLAGAGGVHSHALIAHGGGGWQPQGAPGLGLGGSLDRVVARPDGCEAYGLGRLSHAGGAAVPGRLVRWTGERWEGITDAIPADATCVALAVSRTGDVMVGCNRFEADDLGVASLWRLQGDTLVRVPVRLPGFLNDVAFDPAGSLWIAGGSPGGFIARLDGDDLTLIEQGFNGLVTRIDARGPGDLVVGGAFTRIGNQFAQHIARWDGVEWLSLGNGVPGLVNALARDGHDIYVSTEQSAGGALLLGRFRDGAWSELAVPGSGLTAVPFVRFERIIPLDGGVLLAGVVSVDDSPTRGLLFYRDGSFHAVGDGVRATSIDDAAVTADAVWVAGRIFESGFGPLSIPSVGIARWNR